MSRIFISYRREDTSGYAGRLSERLRSHFGDHQVFMDIDAIEPGLDYQEFVESTIDTIDVMVALIGRQWLTVLGPTGRWRLDDPDDFVRLEIAGALERRIRVIPVLLEGTAMPTVQDLPPPLVPLAHRNAIELSDSRWDYDCHRLVSVLERALAGPGVRPAVAESPATPPTAPARPERPPRGRQGQRAMTTVAAAAAAVLIWGVLAPRGAHPELAGLRMAFEAILVVTVVVTLWSREWKWALGGGILGVFGLVIWAQLLLSGGHTMSDLFTSPDGASNVLAFIASTVVLGSGLMAIRAEPDSSRTPV
jgi:hypothetical protein